MKAISFNKNHCPEAAYPEPSSLPALSQTMPDRSIGRDSLRHILVGSPAAVRQTIYLLHALRYAETVLWSPIIKTKESLIIAPAKGEAISLLRRYL